MGTKRGDSPWREKENQLLSIPTLVTSEAEPLSWKGEWGPLGPLYLPEDWDVREKGYKLTADSCQMA